LNIVIQTRCQTRERNCQSLLRAINETVRDRSEVGKSGR